MLNLQTIATIGRRAPALALAATVLIWPASADVAAAPPDGQRPAARIEIVVKTIHIFDDRDPGDGDMELFLALYCGGGTAVPPTPCVGDYPLVDRYEHSFIAGSGETITLNQVLPRSAPWNPEYDAAVILGYPLYLGRHHELRVRMQEDDFLSHPKEMGSRHLILTEANNWGIGTHKLRSTIDDRWGDFEIELEIRPARLPDLRPVSIDVRDIPGSPKKVACVGIQNVGIGNAGPFELALRTGNVTEPVGRVSAGHLASGDGGPLCTDAVLPASGQHLLLAVVDGADAVPEYDETNNVYEFGYAPTAAPEPTPTPTPKAARPDLAVSAIEVNGRVPDGKDDCKDGRNAVTAVVKNQGTDKTGDFVVRLVVDDEQDGAKQKSVDGLDAGEEREVTFGDVRLTKGQHTLSVTVDAEEEIAESDEGNNARNVAARCDDDD